MSPDIIAKPRERLPPDFVGLESNPDIISNSIFSASSNVISVGYCFVSGVDKSKRSYLSHEHGKNMIITDICRTATVHM